MKNKKSIITIITLLIIGLAIGLFGIAQNSQTITMAKQKNALAYNHSASNILDNVYEKNGLTILPFIYQNSEETISKSKVEQDFKKAGKTIKSISTNHIGTGTQIVTDTKTYNVIVYGDVDGDGYVDSFDAQDTLLHYVFGGKYSLTGLYELAANVDNEDEEVDSFDAQRILLFYVGFEDDLVINKPTPTPDSGDSGTGGTGGSGGSTGGGTTNKDTQKPTITLTGDNPQYITLGEDYTELGATVTDNVDKNPTLTIDSTKVNPDVIGEYTVTYTAKDSSGNTSTTTRKVIVQEPVKQIEIETLPTKTTYKVLEDINVTGGKIKVTDKSDNTETIDMENYMLSGYNPNTAGTQTITVTYRGKTTTFTVTVKDYITGIEITSTDHKVDYVYEEGLDTSKLVVKAIYAGSTESKQIQISDLDITEHIKTQLGEQTVTIEYTTTDTVDGESETFEATYNVTVTNKPLKNIIVTPKLETLVGYRYKTFEIATVQAGTGEEPLTAEKLTFEIKNESDSIVSADTAEATVTDNQFEEAITISFMAKQVGKYKITPKVRTIAGDTITGDTITVEIDEDITVNKITFSDTIEGKFRVGHTKEIGVIFTHKYEENVENPINVAANRITIEGIDYDLKTETGTIIDVSKNPNMNVGKIQFKATQEGQTTIKVYVDKGKENEMSATLTTITILPTAKVYVRLADTSNNITLHTSTPSPEDPMVKEINGLFYTLREIYLEDEDGNKTAVTRDDIAKDNILIVDSLYTPQGLYTNVDTRTFIEQSGKIVETTQAGEIKYIGIALKEGAEALLIGEQVIITYNQDTQNQIVLNINIPVQPISEVNVTSKADPVIGHCYKTFDIATIVSGTNEEEITSSNIEYEVKEVIDDETENDIDLNTTTDISITLVGPANQFTEESTIQFMAKNPGKYKIIPKVGEIEGTAINVEVDEDPTVTTIKLTGISNGDTLAIGGQTKQIGIEFVHKYEENVERPVEVAASRITVEAEEISYNLLTSAGVIITTQTELKVGKINLKPTDTATEEEKTITITVDKGETTEKSITITVNVEKLTLTAGSAQEITLYTSTTGDNQMIKEENGNVYTLLALELNDGTKVKPEDFTDGTIQVFDNESDPTDEFAVSKIIEPKFYKTVEGTITKITNTTDPIEYIGISAGSNTNIMSGKQVKIYYNGELAITLKIVLG